MLMLGVDQHSQNADVLAHPQATVQRIDQQVFAKSLPLPAQVNRQARQTHHGDWEIRQAVSHLDRQVPLIDAATYSKPPDVPL